MAGEPAGKKRLREDDEGDGASSKRFHTTVSNPDTAHSDESGHQQHIDEEFTETQTLMRMTDDSDSSGNSSDTDEEDVPMDVATHELNSDEEEDEDKETGEVRVIKGGLTRPKWVESLKNSDEAKELAKLHEERMNSILDYYAYNAQPYKVRDEDIEGLVSHKPDPRARFFYVEDDSGDCVLESLGNGLFREKGSTVVLKQVGDTGDDGFFRLKQA
ncbi:uncharacterized protein K452DRAFT_297077 [Aplosporella prunicola CBS 121167]|uniref:Uncharacterized protein n=1 Tax=Aplosporella prunicola CBS 121167 TaxID=1176127 RepID=A0A6A6BGN9_9PEZI|nr:uncharacterized protein K452DRAFT_297077 [Aplosporella prunicola CBS 121167]KAF2143322.1 hypothetical protein K452DRAFT_297077 [Aplosporella prunicola CBS 121167]